MDIASLLIPITAEAPCGTDMSFSNEFDAIQEMRREEDPTLAQGDWIAERKVADWPGVIALCESLLRTGTKDLRVVGWWADANARVRGPQGMADGLALAAALVDTQWDFVHPLLEDGDIEPRVGTLFWLLARVEEMHHIVPIASPLGGRRLTLGEVDAARARQQAIAAGTLEVGHVKAEGKPLIDEIYRHVSAGGLAAFEATLAQARALTAALGRLEQAVDACVGRDGPGFAAARKAAAQGTDALLRLGRDCGLSIAVDETARSVELSADGGQAGIASPPVAIGPLQSRAQALAQLREVAVFFRRTEPHSPVAYLADKAARWGDMPLHVWLRSVVKDGAALVLLEEILGVDSPPPAEGE
jgi:type VI secretion system protein ImpA